MEFRGQLYSTLIEWGLANEKAHETLKPKQTSIDEDNNPIFHPNGYTSKKYQSEPIKTIDNKFILFELKGFEEELKNVGFDFKTYDKLIIKKQEL
jgi:hypothetical protein